MAKAKGTKYTQKSSPGLAVASLVFGIIALVGSIIWYVGIFFGILAVIFGAVTLKTAGRGKAIAGIITGSLGIVVSLMVLALIAFAIPALQENQRDTARKSDITKLATDVTAYQTTHQGALPVALDLPTTELNQVKSITGEGRPTTDLAVYQAGKNCDGAATERAYSVSILLENGSVYCQGS